MHPHFDPGTIALVLWCLTCAIILFLSASDCDDGKVWDVLKVIVGLMALAVAFGLIFG